jgi:cytochrome P450
MLRYLVTGTTQASLARCKIHSLLSRFVTLTRSSRSVPHRKLKKFLSPAFTVAYIDKLETLFSQCINELFQKYQSAVQFDIRGYANYYGTEIDLMDDLHNVALDM